MLHYFLVLPRYGINSKAILLSILSYYLYSLFLFINIHSLDIYAYTFHFSTYQL